MMDPATAVVFSDLDGTLLDHDTYAADAALPAIQWLKRHSIPIVLVSSKTRAEIEHWQQDFALACPFVTENGSAIHVPYGYFPTPLPGPRMPTRDTIASVLTDARAHANWEFVTFSEMGAEGIQEATGLSAEDAQRANQRESSEPLQWLSDKAAMKDFSQWIQSRGLRCLQGGRFLHVQGPTDKGIALQRLIGAFDKYQDRQRSIALGDGPNDSAMLDAADVAVIIAGARSSEICLQRTDGILQPEGRGPAAWSAAIATLFDTDFSGT